MPPKRSLLMSQTPAIVLFRRDLRLRDHAALAAAGVAARPVIPLYVLDATEPHPISGARRWWLHRSLESLQRDLLSAGSPLVLRRNNTLEAIGALCRETGARAVFWSRRYLRPEADRDRDMARALERDGIEAKAFVGELLREPGDMLAPSSGEPYRVFTPFFRRLLSLGPQTSGGGEAPVLRAPAIRTKSDALGDWRLLPTRPDWAREFGAYWRPGEDGAWDAARRLGAERLSGYSDRRDFPAEEATSRLSPHLAFGEISPTALWRAIEAGAGPGRSTEKFLSEVAWREFCHHLLHAFPHMATAPLAQKFTNFPYRDDPEGFRRWTKGETGYPMVDAGMRQLWRTGWMHNRVRMIAASFLTKHLLIDWRAGEAWFADTLCDYDPASNIANWQWVAGCGADAAPYFRIFNPATQGEKFDPEGAYVRRFVPELRDLPASRIHQPCVTAQQDLLGTAGAYPKPMVDHAKARARALAALEGLGAPLAETRPDAYVT